MTTAKLYQDKVLPWWQGFMSGKPVSAELSSDIAASWQRCREARVNPYGTGSHRSLESKALSELLVRKGRLLETARPVMENLYKFVQGSGFVVVLTDEQGYIMELLADEDVRRNPMTSDFFQGAGWSEDIAGTNAIGTALYTRLPLQVSGAEHFCQQHHSLTCSAAPLLDRQGRILGVLDMSGAVYRSHLHTLGMVAAAAEAIMAQLHLQQKNKELLLTNNRLASIFSSMSDGVLLVNDSGALQQLNPAARTMLNVTDKEVLGVSADRLLGSRSGITRHMLQRQEPYEDVELIIDSKKGMVHCWASGNPLIDEHDRVSGGVIILRPMQYIQSIVNRCCGNHAALHFGDIIGESREILETVRLAKLAAATAANILLHGESGTGKEIFAQAIHNGSERKNGPFVAVNCGVIPRELIGSELFGYVEGAFTGAKRGGKSGKFELASGGTLFLDEIGDMPLEQQVALLRVLQEKTVTRIGSDKVIAVNVRIICATNKNLLQEVERGSFRKDLYYRLNVISLTVPALRSRPLDVPLLFQHFLKRLSRERGMQFQVEEGALEALAAYSWPGNVRELQNMAERVVSLTDGPYITLAHLPDELLQRQERLGHMPAAALAAAAMTAAAGPAGRGQRRQLAAAAERQQIVLMLDKWGGNVSAAAREMEISRNTLYRKIREYGIEN